MSIPIGYQKSDGSWVKIGDAPIPTTSTPPPSTTTPEPTPTPPPPTTETSTKDKWGIQMIVPTKSGGRTWFLNETNPEDGQFYNKSGTITNKGSGEYVCSQPAVRLYVKSPAPLPLWKNTEITGYYKIESGAIGRNAIQHYGRGGIHTNSTYTLANGQQKLGNPMGTKYSVRIYSNGDTLSAKECGHSVYAGYRSAKNGAVPDLIPGRWFGWKSVINEYKNAAGKECVSMKGYIDDNAQDSSGKCTPKNAWKLLTYATDEGDWNNFDQAEFDNLVKQGCLENTGMTATQFKSFIITWPGHPTFVNDSKNRAIACCCSFRWDDLSVRFKYLSAREITPNVK